jgi:hypothetical protein
MAFPVAIAAAGAAAYALFQTGAGLMDIADRIKPGLMDASKDWIAGACGDIGLELSPDGHLTEESLTKTINNLIKGTGVQLDSLLDRDKLRAGLERDGMAMLAERVGVSIPGGGGGAAAAGMAAVKQALQGWALDQAHAQLQAKSGSLMDAAKPSPTIIKAAEICPRPASNWNDPVNFTKKGIANRARQKKWRDSHTKHWVAK